MENMKKIRITDEEDEVLYRYRVTDAGNARSIYMEKYETDGEEDDVLEEYDIMVAKAGWYCIAFPDMGTASPALTNIQDFGFIADQVHDAGYWDTDVDAIALAIMDIADSGF